MVCFSDLAEATCDSGAPAPFPLVTAVHLQEPPRPPSIIQPS